MSDVKRYDSIGVPIKQKIDVQVAYEESPVGAWVLYSDHEAAVKAAVREELDHATALVAQLMPMCRKRDVLNIITSLKEDS